MTEALGSDTFVHVATPLAGRLVVRVAGADHLAVGTAVTVTPRADMTHAFDSAGRPLVRTT
jgi:multiple sugar transport system ATP-binding protein